MKKNALRTLTDQIMAQEAILKEGGGTEGKERQRRHGRLTARERLELLSDPETPSSN